MSALPPRPSALTMGLPQQNPTRPTTITPTTLATVIAAMAAPELALLPEAASAAAPAAPAAAEAPLPNRIVSGLLACVLPEKFEETDEKRVGELILITIKSLKLRLPKNLSTVHQTAQSKTKINAELPTPTSRSSE